MTNIKEFNKKEIWVVWIGGVLIAGLFILLFLLSSPYNSRMIDGKTYIKCYNLYDPWNEISSNKCDISFTKVWPLDEWGASINTYEETLECQSPYVTDCCVWIIKYMSNNLNVYREYMLAHPDKIKCKAW
jgi:hypothetical protein